MYVNEREDKQMERIYIASDMFSTYRKGLINKLASALRRQGREVYVPHEHEIEGGWSMPNREWGRRVFEEDVAAIDWCDTVIYFCEGMTGDIGSAWECGYAYAKGKKILVQFLGKPTDKISLMVANSTHIELTMYQS